MLFNTVIVSTVTACTSSEVISISNIFIVDVYMTYIRVRLLQILSKLKVLKKHNNNTIRESGATA